MLNTNLTLVKSLYLNSKFRQFSPKIKISLDLTESEYTRQFGGAKCKADIGILQFFITNIYLGKLVLNLKSCWIRK